MLSEAINTAMLTAGARLINTDSQEDNAIAGSLAFTGVNATVTDGVISPKVSRLFLDTEGAATSDTLSHIATTTATNNPRDGAILFIAPLATAREIVISDRATSTATGSIHLLHATDVTLDQKEDTVLLEKRGEDWYQVAGAGAFGVFSTATEPARRGFIDGMQLANTSTDTANDVDIGPGQATLTNSSGDRKIFDFPSTVIKRMDATWATGSSVGGLPSTVTYAATQTLHAFALGNATFGVEFGFDTSVSATGLLATATEFTYHRLVMSLLTTTATQMRQFKQRGDHVLWTDPPLSYDTATVGTTATLADLDVPTGLQVDAVMNLLQDQGTGVFTYVSSPDADDEAPSETVAPLGTIHSDVNYPQTHQKVEVRTNTSGQVRLRASGGVTNFRIATLGFRHDRGQNATAS